MALIGRGVCVVGRGGGTFLVPRDHCSLLGMEVWASSPHLEIKPAHTT